MQKEGNDFIQVMMDFRKVNLSILTPGLNHCDFVVVKTIYLLSKEKQGPVKVSDIIKRTEILPPAISRCLKNMEEKGFVKRETDPDDRRNTHVELTKSGMEIFRQSDARMQMFSERVFEQMGMDNVRKLTEYMRRLLSTAQAEIEKMEEGEEIEYGKNI